MANQVNASESEEEEKYVPARVAADLTQRRQYAVEPQDG